MNNIRYQSSTNQVLLIGEVDDEPEWFMNGKERFIQFSLWVEELDINDKLFRTEYPVVVAEKDAMGKDGLVGEFDQVVVHGRYNRYRSKKNGNESNVQAWSVMVLESNLRRRIHKKKHYAKLGEMQYDEIVTYFRDRNKDNIVSLDPFRKKHQEDADIDDDVPF